VSASGVRLATFAALSAFCAYHWFALVESPPIGRLAALIAVAVGLAAALPAAAALGRPRLAAVAASVAALMLALAVTGLEVRLIWPGGWSELRASLEAGLSGVSQVELPYAGPDEWTRLGILLAAPPAVAAAAAIAFWPSRRLEAARRGAAMALLVALYGFAVTWEAPSAEPARGLALLTLASAYLWLPGLPRARAIAAVVAIALAGGAATALAARVGSDDPIIDYRDWSLFGADREVSFTWDHTYGPFDWPQRGTVVMEIRSDRPLLWRTTVLDTFDGSRWLRAPAPGVADAPPELAGASERMVETNRRLGWLEFPGVEIRALRSTVVVGAGVTREVSGIDAYSLEPDGVVSLGNSPLTEGDSYSVTSYAPDPSARQLRRARGPYPSELVRYTELALPYGAAAVGVSPAVAPEVPVTVPLRGSPDARGDDPVGTVVAGTAYERVHALARRVTRDTGTAYGAVRAIEQHLKLNYRYAQDVPLRRNPLPAFLFMDRAGYCQQFSGAMALMLRMLGIPARVATGFSPGFRAPEDNVYSVRDTDAHSWVEVWFRGIGWVAFDPTPGSAPAQAQSLGAFRGRTAAAGLREGRVLSVEEAAEAGSSASVPSQGSGGGGGPTVGGALALALIATTAAAAAQAGRRRRRMLEPDGARLQIEELAAALPRLGFQVHPCATLLQMERAVVPAAGPRAGRYVGALRANRYARGRPRRPGPAERRALRRALARGSRLGALSARWRALRAIPPGGPRGGG
jgi:protein-glutamine gamma-glutamyltransferase